MDGTGRGLDPDIPAGVMIMLDGQAQQRARTSADDQRASRPIVVASTL
jgi:hypothetical protein